MSRATQPITLLMAEDDADDRLLTQDAIRDARVANPLRFAHDDEELMNYLLRRGPYAEPSSAPRPGLILLDLNMPKKNGREALHEIRADPDLRRIPVVVPTPSKVQENIYRSYDLGMSSFIIKPVTFEVLVELMKTMGQYWVEFVELPS